jgi:hypothetical protein
MSLPSDPVPLWSRPPVLSITPAVASVLHEQPVELVGQASSTRGAAARNGVVGATVAAAMDDDAANAGRITIVTIAIPGAASREFDHAAFDARSRRVFIAHTARDCVEVIDHDAGKHLATLPGFPGVAGAVADNGQILVTNSASALLLDANTLKTRAKYTTGGRPNGAVIVARKQTEKIVTVSRSNAARAALAFALISVGGAAVAQGAPPGKKPTVRGKPIVQANTQMVPSQLGRPCWQ